MSYEFIEYSTDDGIATVEFNRPDRLNAFTRAMGREVIDAMDRIDSDDDVRVAVFTGRGRAFCAGADIGDGAGVFERGADEPFDMARHADYGGYLARRLFDSTKPLIAAINGAAVGVGATATLPMDVRLASSAARFGFVFARRGIVPESCSSWFLPRIVGISQAAEWVFTGRVFDADEACRAGLVRSVHPPEDLLPAAYRLAREMREATSPVAVAISRRMLWQMFGTGSPELAHEIDSRGIHFLGRSADCAEGVEAFLEKRPPRFPMRVSSDLPEYMKAWQRLGMAEELMSRLAGEEGRGQD
ncbi:enoyl-CoA hydratase-related protein [Nocardia sp. CA-120079]|uniref:enoyl-CoA hydratase-related protein n=1 Tax=Nocardia sp. CA-120079 TaxID=3239974 RepID=UPI003D96FF6E